MREIFLTLTIQLQQSKSKLLETEQKFQIYDQAIVPIPDRRLWEDLQEKEDIIDQENKQIEVADTEVQRMKDQMHKTHLQVEEKKQRISHTLRTHKEEFEKLYDNHKTLKLHFEWQERLIDDLNRPLKI